MRTALNRYAARCVNVVSVVTRIAVPGARSAPRDAGNQPRALGYQGRSPWLVGLVLVLASAVAHAHVVVLPRESQAGAEQRYTVRVPTEGQVTTTSVELEVPADVTVMDVPTGESYTVDVRRDGGRIVAITWKRDIKPRDVGEFVFMARNPRSERIVWRAHQRFADGATTDWVGVEGDRRPAAITKLAAAQE